MGRTTQGRITEKPMINFRRFLSTQGCLLEVNEAGMHNLRDIQISVQEGKKKTN